MKGAKAEPIRAHIEDVPTAMFLTPVGTSSAEQMYATAKAAELKNFPTVASVMFTHTISVSSGEGRVMGGSGNEEEVVLWEI